MAKKKEIKPRKPWHGAQRFEGRLRIPCHVVMPCKLMSTNPGELPQGAELATGIRQTGNRMILEEGSNKQKSQPITS